MAKARAIVKRLKAVKNIRKITRTMELIATARFKKAMDRASEAAAYTKKISELVADLSQANLEFHHPLLEKHESEQNAVLLILTSNRGLCGGYNSGVLKASLKRYQDLQAAGLNVHLEVSGKRGISFLKFQNIAASETYTHFEDRPTFEEVDQLASRFITDYIEGKIDRLDVAYTEFVSSSRQQTVVQSLLPIGALGSSAETSETAQKYDYEFLPSAQEILEEIVPTAFKARLFKCFLDAAVSEQIARMVAMKGATENANDMVGSLSAQYNRARQSQITSEILEIIGGAAALE
ncbi:ATP synthase F1 subunit gamma [uncultured Gimesia sp.]|uniref:ATP synthase F1 subunit gamma n=1 Tax=uncultured Gimesia sp. TaxID=1678688 RepID=UPI0030D76E7E|tara:strand:+ start:8102 stop:8980 length:879 start_codon:yes stop_codon:yes gene_type:complete